MANLKISHEEAILQITERIDAIQTIEKNPYDIEYYNFIRWCSKTGSVIDSIYEVDEPHPEEILSIGLQNCSRNSHTWAHILTEVYHAKLLDYIREIQDSMKTTAGSGS